MHLVWASVCLLALQGARAEPCAEGEEGACPAQEQDASALLQHPAHRAPDRRLQTRTNVVMMNAENSTKPRRRHRVPFLKRVHETEHDCDELKKVLHRVPGLRKAGHLFRYMCNDDGRERLSQLKDGCLYLPDNKHMTVLYESVDHPNPWHFFDMFEDSFFPAPGRRCPTDAPGASASALEGAAAETCSEGSGFAGVDGACIHAQLVGSTPKAGSNVRVYKLDGLMGLDETWEHIVVAVGHRQMIGRDGKRETAASHKWSWWNFTNVVSSVKDTLGWSGGPAPTPSPVASAAKQVQMRVRYYVCDSDSSGSVSARVTDDMIHQQTEVLNKAYAGEDKCEGTLSYTIHKADSGFRFVEDGIVRVTHSACASDCSENIPTLTGSFAKREDGLVKVVLCETQLLGIASFPGYAESQRILIVNPDSLPGGAMNKYNLGKTMAHEMGHYLGSAHTFNGGCGAEGDGVADTNPEEEPNFGCPGYNRIITSCGDTLAPVHNIMDYSDDRCMCVFTSGQVQNMWSDLEAFQPDLLAKVLPSAPAA